MLLIRRIIILLFAYFIVIQGSQAITFTSVQSGPWNDPVTWGQAIMVPNSSDDVVISNGHTVNINSDTYIQNVTVNGTLNFTNYNYMLNPNGDIIVNGNLSGGGTLLFTGSNIQDLGGSASSIMFTTLAISKGGGHVQLGTNIEVIGNLNVSTGVLMTGPHTITIGGNFFNNDVFDAGTGVVNFNGPGNQTIGGNLSSGLSFHVLNINKPSGQVDLTHNITINKALRLAFTSCSLNAGTYLMDLYGSIKNEGSLLSNGTVEFRGGTIDSLLGTGSYIFKQLNIVQNSRLHAIQTASVTFETWIDVGSKLDIGTNTTHNLGQLTGTGILALSAAPAGSAVFCTGDYSVFGGTVEFNRPNSYSIPGDFPGSFPFTNVIIKDAGVKSLLGPMNILNNFTIETGAQLRHEFGVLDVNDFINRGSYTDKLINSTLLRVRGVLDNQTTGSFSMESRTEVTGNLINNGTWFPKATSVLAFVGMGNSVVSGNGIFVSDLLIQRTSTSSVDINSSVIISNILDFPGEGILRLNGDLTLTPTANIAPNTYTNIKRMETAAGMLIVEGNTVADFIDDYPIGPMSALTTVSIPASFTYTGAGVAQIRMKVLEYSSGTDYATKSLILETSNISSVTDFKFDFTHAFSMFVGTPTNVYRKVGATKNSVVGSYIDITNNKFGVNGNGNNFIAGEWVSEAASVPIITSIGSPNACAGDSVELIGSGFTGTTLVEIGSAPAPFVIKNDTLIKFVAVASAVGSMGVTNAAGSALGPVFATFLPPNVFAGSDVTSCGPNSVFLGSSASGSPTVQWTNPGGDGIFDDNTSFNPIYTPGTTDIANGAVTLYVTTTGGCSPAAVDDVIITITAPPTVTVGADQTICSSGNVTLSATFSAGATFSWTGGLGTFSPDATDPNAIYTPEPSEVSAGFVTLTANAASGTCSTATNDVTIFINPQPTIDAMGPMAVCAGEDINLSSFGSASTILWTGGDGVFSLSNTEANPTYQLGTADVAAGFVTLTVTTDDPVGPCNAVFDQLTVNIMPGPTVTLSGDQTICQGGLPGILQATFTGSGPWDFNLDDGTTITPMNAGSSPFDFPVSPSATTIYTITSATDLGCGMAASAAVTVTVNPAPTAIIRGDSGICDGGTGLIYVDLTGVGPWDLVYTDGVSNFPITASSNAYSFGVNPTFGTTYTLVSVAEVGCSGTVSGSATFTVTPIPSASMSGDQTICSGNAASLSVNISGSTGPWDIEYSDGVSTLTQTGIASSFFSFDEFPTTTTSYTLTKITELGCAGTVSSGTTTVTVTAAPTAVLSGDTTICDGGTAMLRVDFTGSGPWDFDYNDGIGTIGLKSISSTPHIFSVNPLLTNTYTAISVVSGCTVTANGNAVVTVQTLATATAGGDQTICTSDSPTLSAAVGGSATTGKWTNYLGTFNPDDITPNAVYTPSSMEITVGSVTLTWSNTDGCGNVSDDVTIFISPGPTVSAGGNQTVCDNINAVALSGSAGGPNPNPVWSTSGGGTFSPNATTLNADYLPSAADRSAGTITLSLTNPGDGTCAPGVRSMQINFTPSPNLTLGVTPAEDTLCLGANGQITIINSESGVSYQADLGGTPVSPLSPGNNSNLDLTLNNATFLAGVDNVLSIKAVRAGCVTTALNAAPIIRKSTMTAPSISAVSGTQLCTGNPVVLSAPAGYPTYQWLRGTAKIVDATGLNYSTLISGSYSVQVSDGLCKPISNVINVNLVSPEPVVTTSGTTLSTTATSSYYQWYIESAPGDSKAIHGANSNTCPVYFNAKYFVAINHNNCRLVSVPVVVNDGGLNPLLRKNYQILNDSSILILPPSEEEITLYPNPAEDAFTVDYQCTASGPVLIELFNSMGDKILSKTVSPLSGTVNETFNNLDVQPGIYLVSITEGNKRVVRNIQIN